MIHLKVLLACFLLFASTSSYAGVFEFSAQGSLRETNVSENNESESRSSSVSLAYYFWETGALEFTYMTGYNYSKTTTSTTTLEQSLNYTYGGVDLVYNLGTRESTFNPYVKAGIAEIKKRLTFREDGNASSSPEVSGKNLTYGLGFKLRLTKTFSLRLSYDVWQGPIDGEESEKTTDTSTKVGFSWYL
ncbi:MAG: hypothetical protein CL674_15800 [Bdellovibrionaceae bacterium]|nr:hypothetical protein [Pseudobdellovibrionaceae bacterium]|tara:strand:+ start:1487 stop:2053 length:567 start_codon:yes stop_codon:yes gene_type:complete